MHWLMNSPEGFDAVLVIAAILGVVFYLLPSLLAWSLNSKNLPWMALVNVILGWTIIGWMIVLVWALFSARNPEFDDIALSNDDEIKNKECA